MEGQVMKLHLLYSGILLLGLAACSTSYHAANHVDDIYYTPQVVRPGADVAANQSYGEATVVEVPRDHNRENNNRQVYNENGYDTTERAYTDYDTETFVDEQGNVFINNFYFSDTYDYWYSSRIRRFYRPMYHAGFYDPFYTNMFWYNFDPFYSGVSIYMGYGAFPIYYPGYYWNPAFHWSYGRPFYSHRWWRFYDPFHPFGYSHFHNPFFAYHHPFYFSTHYAHFGHFGSPYFYQYIYNSRDRSNYHYGPRGGGGSTTRIREESGGMAGTFAERFEASTARGTSPAPGDVALGGRSAARSGGDQDASKSGEAPSTRPQRGGATSGQTVNQPRTAGVTSTGRQEASGSRQPITDQSRTGVATTQQTRGDDSSVGRRSANPEAGTVPSRPSSGSYARPEAGTTPSRPQSTPAGTTAVTPQTRPQAVSTDNVRVQQTNAPRYARPEQSGSTMPTRQTESNYTPPRTYTFPSYQQPRSNEQYRSTQPARPAAVTPPREAMRPPVTNDVQQARPQSEQTPQTRPQTVPARQDGRQPTYSPPPRHQTPTRTTQPTARPASSPTRTTQPAASPSRSPSSTPRSTPSVSPSRSSGGSSAPASSPSRSSGGSSSSSGRSRQ